jgi:hypothetical protein
MTKPSGLKLSARLDSAAPPAPPPRMTILGTVHAASELLRSPVSGLACVHWRLRITQHIAPRMQLVHEVASPEAFELYWARASGEDAHLSLPPLRLRLDPESARIQAAPVLHREGTPGALAAGRHFGLDGALRVEEVMLHQGEEVSAEGILDDSSAVESPFRSAARGPELLDSTLRVPTPGIGPALLPWALGTAAVLLSATATATYWVWRYHARHNPFTTSQPAAPQMRIPFDGMKPPEPPHPRLP